MSGNLQGDMWQWLGSMQSSNPSACSVCENMTTRNVRRQVKKMNAEISEFVMRQHVGVVGLIAWDTKTNEFVAEVMPTVECWRTYQPHFLRSLLLSRPSSS